MGHLVSTTNNFCDNEYLYQSYNNHLPGVEMPENLLLTLLKRTREILNCKRGALPSLCLQRNSSLSVFKEILLSLCLQRKYSCLESMEYPNAETPGSAMRWPECHQRLCRENQESHDTASKWLYCEIPRIFPIARAVHG